MIRVSIGWFIFCLLAGHDWFNGGEHCRDCGTSRSQNVMTFLPMVVLLVVTLLVSAFLYPIVYALLARAIGLGAKVGERL